MGTDIEEILTFWFEEAGPGAWWSVSADFDALVSKRFSTLHEEAGLGKHDSWAQTPRGSLALVILLDQFSRNMFRGTSDAFASDARAREIAREAIRREQDQALSEQERHFLYMPFMHSEFLEDQDFCVQLGETRLSDEGFLKFAHDHREVIVRFGRFPHRNAALGRRSTPEEEKWLDEGGGW